MPTPFTGMATIARVVALFGALMSPVGAFYSTRAGVSRQMVQTCVEAGSQHEVDPIVEDLRSYCAENEHVKAAAVYAVLDRQGIAQYVGMSRDVRSALVRHAASQPTEKCAKAQILLFAKPCRETMNQFRDNWITAFNPPGNGNESWERPPLSSAEADRKLRLRQAIADDTLRDDEPEAWNQVVRKAMKDDGFDGSEADRLDAQVLADERATRRASGDWMAEVAEQTAHALRPSWQTADLEMYSTPHCAHCERMRAGLRQVGAFWIELNIEALPLDATDDQHRRARHARFETVPQLYVLRRPPLNGRPAEWLVGGADDLENLLAIPETTAFSFKGRISDPTFL